MTATFVPPSSTTFDPALASFDPLQDFLQIIDFQESVTFHSKVSATAWDVDGIPLNHVTRRNPESGTTGEGRTTQLRRVRFFGGEDLEANEVIFLLSAIELGGPVPNREDKIVDANNAVYILKYVETNQNQIGTYRCVCYQDHA